MQTSSPRDDDPAYKVSTRQGQPHALWGALVGALAAVALLSGCAAGLGKTDAPPDAAVDRSYGTVVELRDALVTSGYPCIAWREGEASNFAGQSGACDDTVVMSTYATDTDKAKELDRIRELSHVTGGNDTSGLVGSNWLMVFKTTQLATDVQAKLGGTLVNFAPAK